MSVHKNTIMVEYIKPHGKEPFTFVGKIGDVMMSIVRDILILSAVVIATLAYVRVGQLECFGVEDGRLRCIITGKPAEAPLLFETRVIPAEKHYILDPNAGIH